MSDLLLDHEAAQTAFGRAWSYSVFLMAVYSVITVTQKYNQQLEFLVSGGALDLRGDAKGCSLWQFLKRTPIMLLNASQIIWSIGFLVLEVSSEKQSHAVRELHPRALVDIS